MNQARAPRDPKPTVFIGSSTRARERGIVDKLVKAMDRSFEVRPWWSVFRGGNFTLNTLEQEARRAHAALLIFAKDDELTMRGEGQWAARDNVVLEFGLFVAHLSHERVWILQEEGVELPTDVLGLTTYRFGSREGAGQDADLALCVREIQDAWGHLHLLPPRSGEEPIDPKLGYVSTLESEKDHIGILTDALRAYSVSGVATRYEPLHFMSSRAAMSAYSEGLARVERRFWRTTLLRSGFWTRPSADVIQANSALGRRLEATGGSTRTLFLLDQDPTVVADAYRRHRILQRQLEKYDELHRLDFELHNLKRVIGNFALDSLKVVFDSDQAFRALPHDLLGDPLDDELAIYDDFRVDVFEGGRTGVINRMRSYCPAIRNFDGYMRAAEEYFDALWQRADSIGSFLAKLDNAVDGAAATIDYESNWLAIYEFALDRVDEDLKVVEGKRVEEVLRQSGRWGSVGRYLDIGTCTGRYPIGMGEAVLENGYIKGIDEDYDCVRFAKSNLERLAPGERRVVFEQCDFTSLNMMAEAPFDLITCMQGRLSHFGWDRRVGHPLEDSLQRALDRMAKLLDRQGILILGTWSRWACDNRKMLSIYSELDRRRLADWTPTKEELLMRLEQAGLEPVGQYQPDHRLDFTVCERTN